MHGSACVSPVFRSIGGFCYEGAASGCWETRRQECRPCSGDCCIQPISRERRRLAGSGRQAHTVLQLRCKRAMHGSALTRTFVTASNYKHPVSRNYPAADLVSKRRLLVRGIFLLGQTKHSHPGAGSRSRFLFSLLGFGSRNFVAASGANVLVRLNSKLTTRTQVVKHLCRPLSLSNSSITE